MAHSLQYRLIHYNWEGAAASPTVYPFMRRHEWLLIALALVSLVGAVVWLR